MRRVAVGANKLVIELGLLPNWIESIYNRTGCEVAVDLDKCPTFADLGRDGIDGERCIEPQGCSTLNI